MVCGAVSVVLSKVDLCTYTARVDCQERKKIHRRERMLELTFFGLKRVAAMLVIALCVAYGDEFPSLYSDSVQSDRGLVEAFHD
jgi:hypothetical protein